MIREIDVNIYRWKDRYVKDRQMERKTDKKKLWNDRQIER